MLFYIFFFNKFCRKPPPLVCCLLRLGKKSFSFNLQVSKFFIFFMSSLPFLAQFFWYDTLLSKKKKHICKKPLVFVCCPLKLGSKASPLIYRLAKSLFFYELFAFLAPYDCSISFRLVGIRLASHLYLFSIKYDLHLYLFFSWLFLSFI
jgi:hypothetical protein